MPKNLLLVSHFLSFFYPHNITTSWLWRWMLSSAILFSGVAVGQNISNYTFSESMGSYSTITGTTAIAAGWDDVVTGNTIPLGFTFIYGGTNYSTCSINSNGYITFGAATSLNIGYTPISSGVGYQGAISPLGINLVDDNNRPVLYTTSGTAPNRVFTVQWSDARRAVEPGKFNFQIKLYETSNIVTFIYGNCNPEHGNAHGVQVGLRGPTNADFNNRHHDSNNDWSNHTTLGTQNDDTCRTKNNTYPENGLTFSWTPPPPLPPMITSFPSNTCIGSSIVITGTNLSGATSVTIGGTTATITANTATSITVTIGTGTTGLISITTLGGTATSFDAVTINNPCYCKPSVSIGRQDDNYINNVRFIGTLNDIDNLNTGFSNNPRGYQDFTGISNRAVQSQGERVNIYLENQSNAIIRVWVDWNNDGAFNTTGAEAVYTTGNIPATSTTFGFLIPTAQSPGLYRIRLRTTSSGSDTIDPCNNIDNGGETEDYLFEVVANCSANITNIVCGESCGLPLGVYVNVPMSVDVSAGSAEVRWYSSITGGSLLHTSTISGMSSSWSPLIAVTTTYYVTAFNGTCESLERTEITARVKPVANIIFNQTNADLCGEDSIVIVTASGDNEVVYLIEEDFEAIDLDGLGLFIGQTLATNNALANWRRRESTFIPEQQVWNPSISSGFGANKFAMTASDIGNGPFNNALQSPVTSTVAFLNLTLTFKMYYSDYYTSDTDDKVSIEVSTNGGANWTNFYNYNTSVGIGTRFVLQEFDFTEFIDEPNFRFRIRYNSIRGNGVAIDDIKLYGERPLVPSFIWVGSSAVAAYSDPSATIPYLPGTLVSSLYIKPTLAQLELGTYNFTATATLANGCTTSQPIAITNKSRIWKGTVNHDWDNPNNWLPNVVPTADNCVIIPSIVKIPTGPPLPPFGYEAFAKNITIKSTGSLEILSNNNLTVTDWIHNEGTNNFDIRNDASLIQINSVPNTGAIKMDRTASVKKTDYIYYSSPVDNNNLTTVSAATSNAAKFKWIPTMPNGLFQYGNWASPGPSEIMGSGEGYIVRGPNTFITPTPLTVTFDGTPRNGNIQVPISRGNFTGDDTYDNGRLVTKDDDNYNLVGNPYPSAISAYNLIIDDQNFNISGSIYLWPHGGMYSAANPSPFYQDFGYNYNSEDYITYNSMGSVPPNTFDGYIAAGQAFFVLMTDSLSTNENLYFKNAMRVSNRNDQFLRTTEASEDTSESPSANRMYLDLILPTGKTSSTLIGYTQNATYGLDRLYDSPILDNSSQNIYSVIGTDKLIIQGRPLPLDVMDEVPLGILIPQQGIYTIAIHSLDGVFTNSDQNIFLEDLVTGIVHNLKNAPYMFTAETGRYDNRFILRYNDNNTLNTPEVVTNADLDIIGLKTHIKVVSGHSPIKTISVYDAIGRSLIQYNNVNEMDFKIPLDQLSEGTLIVKVILENGKQKNKKVIN